MDIKTESRRLTAQINEGDRVSAQRAALDDHIETYLRDNAVPVRFGAAIVARDAIEHGWYGATAEIAEALNAIVEEARAEVARRMPYPILKKLDELTEALKRSIGA